MSETDKTFEEIVQELNEVIKDLRQKYPEMWDENGHIKEPPTNT